MGETAKERTGWRDEGISRRHRLWGVECQATDIDFPLLEYRQEHGVVRPAAIIEYKNEHAKRDDSLLAYQALRTISNCANLPFFVTRYTSDYLQYHVIAMNKWAEVRLVAKERKMSEEEYVTFLYLLRGYDTLPQRVYNVLKGLRENKELDTHEQPKL